ncbi:MAG: hypothetical protein A3B96_01685 [Candidatus Spechtbacteria bacterium RIFCSPHIGHO2_02_FULL_43_15b]|uniref:Uncharacterized protein n=1 Tax=Candidatus Spechtbacteria bacterium RIFCSPHIGHO2_01_FULL_43_30 TaxID=1802158 RepID=A0A1G2H6E7_9BACT|nr:MAG: hypothetical protein A2827_01385 [Candidatus Spechtbacteria bacterium RIFCSPHIGHO2_01_FULL_43_30]OGZ60468.1 MAG: hypothetical protein A3B96_01685 [Candidatus Spechtbacteria bacterium RIFCSPHIGHO2_02_FULL_43_15b]
MPSKKKEADYKFLGNCPICGKKFEGNEVTPVEEEDGMNTLYAECGKCRSSVVLGVIKNVPGLVTTIGMLTDMKLEDIDRLASLPALTADDVLEVHKYFELK